jgi:hypothetical protein
MLKNISICILFYLFRASYCCAGDTVERDYSILRNAVLGRIERWEEYYNNIPDSIRTTDTSTVAQKKYFERLKLNFTDTLSMSDDLVSDDAITKAIHSSLRHSCLLLEEVQMNRCACGY